MNKSEILEKLNEGLKVRDTGESIISARCGSLIVRCPNKQSAIDKIISKFKKFKNPINARKSTFHRPIGARYSSGTFKSFCRDGEYANAIEYSELCNKEIIFVNWDGSHYPLFEHYDTSHIDVKVGRYYRDDGEPSPWVAVDVNTGARLNVRGTNKEEALKNMKKINAETIAEGRVLFKDHAGFQARTRLMIQNAGE